MIAASMPVVVPDGVTVRNLGSHVAVTHPNGTVSVTWAGGWWLVWSTGVVIGEHTGFDAAVRFAVRHVTAVHVDPAGL